MSREAERLMKRYQKALGNRQMWDDMLRDAFAMAAPNVDSGFTSATKGQDRTEEVVDGTAMQATRDAARATYTTITPPQSQFFELALSRPVKRYLEERGQLQAVEEQLDEATEIWFDHFNASNFSLVAESAYISQQISTGVILMNEDERQFTSSAFRFHPVPLYDVCFEAGPGTMIKCVFQKSRMEADLLEMTWPEIKLTDTLRDKASKDAPEEVDVLVITEIDEKTNRATYMVVDEDSKSILLTRNYRRSPWIIFRPNVAPGEVLGRGPVLDVLPDIRTANKATELVLKNASIAVAGMWQADDDGVINLNNIQLAPGTIIPKAVGSAGLQPLVPGTQFDVSQLILGDLRTHIREHIVGPQFPPLEQSGSMTATETERRVQQFNLLQTPSRLRSWRELVVAMVARGMEILDRRGDLPEMISQGLFEDISAGYVEVIPLSPLARSQEIEKVMQANAALGMAAQSGPEGLPNAADLAGYQAWVLDKGGFPDEFIYDEQERQERAQAAEQMAQIERAAPIAQSAAQTLGAVSGQ